MRDTGLTAEAINDLLLKTLYVQGLRTGQQLVDSICLPFDILDEQLMGSQQRRLVEVRGTGALGRIGYGFDLTGQGRERAREALDASQYVGAAPITLTMYREWVHKQTIQNVHVTRDRIAEGFRDVVLNTELFETLGPAINSAKSLFLFGDSGNGKTMITEAMASMLGDSLFVPHAVDVDGQILAVYDSVYHRPAKDPEQAYTPAHETSLWRRTELEYDRRFARVQRPVVMVGGELTLDQLDLQYDHSTKMYQAPFQMKANGGILIIDDFGRQRVPPKDLLNRWIVPLEKRLDFLTLHTGSKFPVPFDCLLVLSTNLDPTDLADEAFLRRIRYKVSVNSPSPEQYTEIFQRVCKARKIPFAQSGVDFIYREFYQGRGIAPRSCQPRDLLDHVSDIARFLDVEPTMSEDLLNRACCSYFVKMEDV
ncbi:MAG: ATP-binding protein [Gemmatimonadetes bacterium]|nr:ATP-binding protein [Gemmatimonadota bacterium]